MNTQAQDLFTRALKLPEAKREAYLAKACGEDAELRLEVQQLLIDAERADSFFGEPGGDATIAADGSGQTSGKKAAAPLPDTAAPAAEPLTEKEGDVIGPFKLLQPIGEGGFGTVWMAEQSEPISRRVALKVIKAGMDTKEVLARFEAERQALAMMDHPHIAKVLDAGATKTGRPWFAMELVKGIPITEYCDEAELGTTERLALFGDVCAAINHAHQKGVIHRDIKPNNVMVTLYADKPVVKVIDFGIAKATQGKLTDKTLFTRFEQFIGTPVYMSPEQAALSAVDIDTRSDIYALGVLLYELLTGKPPFDSQSLVSAGYDEMRRIIREEEPPRPSLRLATVAGEERTTIAKARHVSPERLSRLVERDLDWIVMKAIEKDRTRRYETANAFAQDIVRFLEDEAVTACPPSKGYQFKKFARRNKAAFRIAALIAVLLVAATAVSSWQAVRATRAENLAAQETVRTKAALEDAKATSKFLTDMITNVRPGEEKGGIELKVADVLDRAAEMLETNGEIPPARRATLQATLGRTYDVLGLDQQAIPLQEAALDYHHATSGPEHYGTLGAKHSLAISYSDAGRLDEALKMQEEVLALSRKTLGPEHPSTLLAMGSLANSYKAVGRRDEALEMKEEVLALCRKVRGAEHPDTLLAMNNLAVSYNAAGRRDEALKMLEEVLALDRKVLGREHTNTLLAMNNLAFSYYAAGRRDEALKMQEEVLALRRKVHGPEHPDTLKAMQNLAISYYDAGRLDEALKMLEQVLALRRKVHGPEHPDTISAMHSLANSYGAGRLDEALKMREEVLALRRKVHGPEHPDTISAMHNVAISYGAGRLDEALKMQEEALALSRKVLGAEHPDTLKAMHNLAISYYDAGRLDEALKMQEEALALSLKVLGSEHPETLRARELLDLIQMDSNDPAIPPIIHPPLGFSLADLAAKDEAGRAPLLGEPDLEFAGEGQDGETGVRFDEKRSYTVKDCTLDLLISGGVTKQVNLTTGFDSQLKGIAAVRAFLGDTVKMGDAEASDETTFHRVQFGEGGEGRVYVEFDEDGVTDTFKLVMPEAGAEPGKPKDASKSK